MKADWDPVKLRVAWGDVPEPGDMLKMPTGRRYQVARVAGKTLHCIVVPRGARVRGRVVPWRWAPRRRRARA